MSESKHTPGERIVDEWVEGSGSDGVFVARVRAAEVTVARFECSAFDPEAIEATRADAHMDAAAPEMLEALQERIGVDDDLLRRGSMPSDERERRLAAADAKMRAATAKATGGES